MPYAVSAVNGGARCAESGGRPDASAGTGRRDFRLTKNGVPGERAWNDVSIVDVATCTVTDRAKIGDSLKIRLPNQYTVRSGATLSPQDTTETSATLQVAIARLPAAG